MDWMVLLDAVRLLTILASFYVFVWAIVAIVVHPYPHQRLITGSSAVAGLFVLWTEYVQLGEPLSFRLFIAVAWVALLAFGLRNWAKIDKQHKRMLDEAHRLEAEVSDVIKSSHDLDERTD